MTFYSYKNRKIRNSRSSRYKREVKSLLLDVCCCCFRAGRIADSALLAAALDTVYLPTRAGERKRYEALRNALSVSGARN